MTGRMGLPRHARWRRRLGPGRWQVRARLERFTEPAVLLVLRDSPGHGYELLEQLQELMPGERIDMGNLYRILRSLERDGLVDSTWDDDAPGPAKRDLRDHAVGPARARPSGSRRSRRSSARSSSSQSVTQSKGGEHAPRTQTISVSRGVGRAGTSPSAFSSGSRSTSATSSRSSQTSPT